MYEAVFPEKLSHNESIQQVTQEHQAEAVTVDLLELNDDDRWRKILKSVRIENEGLYSRMKGYLTLDDDHLLQLEQHKIKNSHSQARVWYAKCQ